MTKQVLTFGVMLLVLAALISGCTLFASEAETTEDGIDVTEEPQAETEEPTEEPTETPRPTRTPRPTATPTPRPTSTARPTATTPPTATAQQATEAPTQAASPAATEETGEVVPPGESIWVLDTTPSETGFSEKCPGPFFADFYGLVRIQTIDGGITWMRAQDGITYTLLRQSPNVYWGTGASIYPGYTLTISVVFASPTGLGATFVLIDQAIEGCNHYWKYGGTLR